MSEADGVKPTERLAPCPFCGGTSIEIQSNGIGDYYAICYGDDDETWCGARSGGAHCESKQHATEEWNRRVNLHDELVEALRKAREYVEQQRWDLLCSCCPGGASGHPDIENVDQENKGSLAADDALLAAIDAVLAKVKP